MRIGVWSGLAAACVGAVLLTGCGGNDGGKHAGKADDAAAAAFAKKSADEIVAAAKQNMSGLESLRLVSGSPGAKDGQDLDLRVASDGSCTGTGSDSGEQSEIRSTGDTMWIRQGDAKWQVVPDGMGMDKFCDLDTYVGLLFADGSTNRTLGTDSADGKPVVNVETTAADGTKVTMSVLTADPHFVVKAENDGDALMFSEFNKDFEVEAPDPGEVAASE